MQIIRRFDEQGISLTELMKGLVAKSIEESINDQLITKEEGILGGRSNEDSTDEFKR
jgi:hypothetical protein